MNDHANVTFIDDLLDLDDPGQRSVYNIASQKSIKTLPSSGNIPQIETMISKNKPRYGSPIDTESEPMMSLSNQHPNQSREQMQHHPNQYPNQHLNQHLNQNPNQHLNQNPNQHPNQHPHIQREQMQQRQREQMQQMQKQREQMQQMQRQREQMQQIQPQMSMQNINREQFSKEKMPKIIERYDNINCRDVAEHIQNCPICSKLYKRKNLVFYIIIIVLILVNLLCIKKILDSK